MPVSVPVGGGAVGDVGDVAGGEGFEHVEHVEVRRGDYYDSVTLMLAARAVAGVADVERVLVAMATELNVALLAELGYSALTDVGPADLIVAFTCASPSAEAAALEALTASLTPASQPGGPITAPGHHDPDHPGDPAPRTMASALGRTGAPITLISTPGLASVAEAMESLEYGASPIIFSDNIPIEHEVRLKDEARRRGLLVMGPDCGTVVLHGTGLAFANVTRPGRISLVAASGTGAQQLMALLDAAGTGIRHCLGVGGRDLTEQVAGRSTLAALTALAEDPETELIAVVSKPPDPSIAARIKAHAATLNKPVHFAFVGPDHPTLTDAAEQLLTALTHEPPPQWPHWPPTTPPGEEHDTSSDGPDRGDNIDTSRTPTRAPAIRGLFSGGTLRTEAEAVLLRAGASSTMAASSTPGMSSPTSSPAATGMPTPPATPAAQPLADAEAEAPAAAAPPVTFDLTDFGDDAYTRGRPHPMIDNTLRLRALADAAADVGVGVVLLDVVLGRGAHADPAEDLAAAIAGLPAGAAVVVSLCGTGGDPQGLGRQAEALARAGAWVFLSNAEAAMAALALARGGVPSGVVDRL